VGIAVFMEPAANYFSNHWLSCIVINEKITGFTREELRLEMAQDNIESRPLWKPMHLQPVFEDATYYGAKVVADLFEKGLCLPSGSNLTDEDRERIASSIQKLLSIK
jgi:dTDP-4-amino-4,6-dideoxygalactose transaminase